jgi:uncharacterized protein YdcH (DUF465 family)
MNPSKDELNLQRLAQKHRELDQRLEVLSDRRFPTHAEQLEEATLKKQKLKLKDEMEAILAGRPQLSDRNG